MAQAIERDRGCALDGGSGGAGRWKRRRKAYESDDSASNTKRSNRRNENPPARTLLEGDGSFVRQRSLAVARSSYLRNHDENARKTLRELEWIELETRTEATAGQAMTPSPHGRKQERRSGKIIREGTEHCRRRGWGRKHRIYYRQQRTQLAL